METATKDPAAVRLGRKGGHATASALSPEQRSQNASNASNARWENSTESQRKAFGKKLTDARKKKRVAQKVARPKR